MTGIDRRHPARIILQQRDIDLLRELAVMRVADRELVRTAARFTSTTRVNTRLLALTRAGLLRRFFLGSGGGRKAIYALSQKGAKLIHVPCRGPRRRQDETLVADLSIQHQLTVNSVYCNLKFGMIPVADVQFVNWVAFNEPLTNALKLIPDGYVEFKMPTGIDASFVEVDLGHEVLSVWKEKARQYLQLAVSGEYTRLFRNARFRVLVLTNSERRMHSLRNLLAGMTQKIFWFAPLDRVAGEQFFAAVWGRPVGDTNQSLFGSSR